MTSRSEPTFNTPPDDLMASIMAQQEAAMNLGRNQVRLQVARWANEYFGNLDSKAAHDALDVILRDDKE